MKNRKRNKNIELIARRITLSYLWDLIHAVTLFMGVVAIMGGVCIGKGGAPAAGASWSVLAAGFIGSIAYASFQGEKRRQELRHHRRELSRIRSSRVVWENGIGRLKVW